jgi:hypothetical protein
MKPRPSRLILPVLCSLSLVQLAQGSDDDVVWKIEKAGFSLAIQKDSFTPQWGVTNNGGEALYFKYSNGRATSTRYPRYMGSIAGVIQEGLAIQVVNTVDPVVAGPRIKFLKSGEVELQFDPKSLDPESAIVLSRSEALSLAGAVQQYFQKQLANQQVEKSSGDAESSKQTEAEQAEPSDGDKPSN